MTNNKKYKVGDILPSLRYGNFEVIELLVGRFIKVRFINTGYQVRTTVSRATDGRIKDKYVPSVMGVGYIGDIKIGKGKREAYNRWYLMLQRCYSGKKRYKAYRDCYVDEKWFCFANFYEWYEKTYPFDYSNQDDPIHLDKDTINPESRYYSEDTCSWIPRSKNLEDMRKRRGNK